MNVEDEDDEGGSGRPWGQLAQRRRPGEGMPWPSVAPAGLEAGRQAFVL